MGFKLVQRKGAVGNVAQWDSLIGDLYESVLNPGMLMTALSRIDGWMGSSCCHLLAWNEQNNSPRLNVLTNDVLSEDIIAKYAAYYGAIDPRRHFSLRQPVGHVYACHDYFDDRFVEKSEFYQDFLIPGGARYILGAYLFRDEGLSAYLVFNHLKDQGHFSAEQREAAARFVPHVQRTIRLAMQHERFRGGLVAGATGLDALEQAVFTLDSKGCVVFLNSAARQLVSAGQWVVTMGGRLLAKSHSEAEKLRSAITRARLTRAPETCALYGIANTAGDPVATQLVTVLPIPREGVQQPASSDTLTDVNVLRASNDATFFSLAEAELVVLVSPQRRRTAISAARLKALFRLTPAEARLAHELAKGNTVEGYADAAALSVATVRTQLRSVLAKTGESRLQDLVRMLSALPGI